MGVKMMLRMVTSISQSLRTYVPDVILRTLGAFFHMT